MAANLVDGHQFATSGVVGRFWVDVTSDRPIVIIACHAWFGDVVGGSFKVATEQAIDLSKRGFRVCYVCSAPIGVELPKVQELGDVEVWRYLSPSAKSPSIGNIRGHVRSTQALIEEIAKTGEVIAIGGHTPLQFRGAIAAGKRIGCSNLIYHVHSPFHEELKAQWSSEEISWKQQAALFLAKLIEKHNLRNASQVQCFSKFTRNLLKELSGEMVDLKTKVVPGWVECSRFFANQSGNEVGSVLPKYWRTDKKTFFTLRRLEPRMGIETLCKAVKVLAESRNDFQVVIGGSGSQRDSLIKYARANKLDDIVFFPGRLEDEEVERAYATADCFVLPTKALECFGLIILEAWANNIPVISSRVGAIPELVDMQDGDWMFEAGDSKQLAEKMAAFLEGELSVDQSLRSLAEQFDSERGLNQLFSACYSQLMPEAVQQ